MTNPDHDPLLRARVERLPRELPPPRDLWPAIRDRIAREQRRRRALRVVRAVACAGVAIAAAAAVAIGLRTGARSPASPVAVAPAPAQAAAGAAALFGFPGESDYAGAEQTLAREMREHRAALLSGEAAVLEANIRILDEAIASTRAALLAHPEDAELQAELDRTWEDKLDLLRDVSELPNGR
jgi:hypothetical protein